MPKKQVSLNVVNIKGTYREVGLPTCHVLERYTVFVKYGKGEDAEVEEIDVDAINREHAKQIAESALERDYQPGGKIAEIVHRPRGVMYL